MQQRRAQLQNRNVNNPSLDATILAAKMYEERMRLVVQGNYGGVHVTLQQIQAQTMQTPDISSEVTVAQSSLSMNPSSQYGGIIQSKSGMGSAAGHIKVTDAGQDIQEIMDILVEQGLDHSSEEYAIIKISLMDGCSCFRCRVWCRLPVITPCRHLLCLDYVAWGGDWDNWVTTNKVEHSTPDKVIIKDDDDEEYDDEEEDGGLSKSRKDMKKHLGKLARLIETGVAPRKNHLPSQVLEVS